MKKTLSRILAVIMSLVFVLTSIPLSGLTGLDFGLFKAKAAETETLVMGKDHQITRAEWLHNLAILFDMTVEDKIYPDNYFSDLDEKNKYYYDILLTVNFGVVDIEAGGKIRPDAALTRSFASETLNYCHGYQLEEEKFTFSDASSVEKPADAQIAVNRGWFKLVSGKFNPNASVTASEVSVMIKDTQKILESKVIDTDHKNKYTFDSSVIEIKDGTKVEVDGNTVTITNSPKTIKAGNKFAVYQNGIPKIYEAVKATTSANLTRITVNPDFDGSNLFLSVDAEGVTDISAIDLTPAEDTTMSMEVVPQSASSNSRASIKLDKVYNFTKSFDFGGASVSCTVKMKNPVVEYKFKTETISAMVVFDGDAEISFTGNFDIMKDIEKDEILIGTIGVPGIGGVSIYVKLSLEGSIGFVTEGDLRFGFTYSISDGLSAERSFTKKSFSMVSEASAKAGLIAKFGITDAPVVNAYVFVEAGGKVAFEAKVYADGKKPKECANFAACLYANYGINLTVKVFNYSAGFEITCEIYDIYNSPVRISRHYEDGKEVCSCARGGPIGYFTPWNSYFNSCGWSEGFGSRGYGRGGEPIIIYEYSLDDANNATITSYKGNATALHIPATIDGHKVVGLGNSAFKGNQYLRTVIIPDSVVKIEDNCFENCTALRNVTIPDSVTTIANAVFNNCAKLENIDYSDKLISIGNLAFKNTAIVVLDIPNSVTSIGHYAFADCKNLSKVNLSKSLKSMGSYAFARCDGLNSIEIPKSLEQTYNGYYNGATVYDRSYGVFIGCKNLKTVTFEEGTSTIAPGLFSNNESLERIDIPDTVTKIGYYAFNNCVNLKDVKFSKNLLTIENFAFKNTAITEVDIPDTVSVIDFYAFADCKNLSKVDLPKSLKSMGAYAFARCDSLKSVEIPKSLEETYNGYYDGYGIPDGTYGGFVGCKNLKTVTFEKGTSIIAKGLFANNASLEKIEIPDTVTKIDYRAFLNCTNLKEVVVSKKLVEIGEDAFKNTSLSKITLPNTLTTIGNSAFNTTPLESIVIPDSVTSMGNSVFQASEKLKSVVLPKTRQDIGSSMFEGCKALEKIELPSTVTTIHNHAFKGCTSLNKVVFNKNIVEIKKYAFENCDSLKDIAIPESVTTLGEGVFYDCDKLTNVTLGSGTTSIPARMFEHCDVLPSIVIPYGVKSIGANSFKECVKLTSVTLPRTITSAQTNAFSYPQTMTIYGVKGTYAETYANQIGAKFVDKQVNATSVKFSESKVTVNKGQTKKLIQTITPSNFTDAVIWKSSNTSVATVSENGTITAKSVGTTTIKLTVGSATASCEVQVVQPVTSTNIKQSQETLKAFDTIHLTVTVNPNNAANKAVKWSSSASDIASVDSNGLVTAHKKGEATIRVEALDGSGVYDTCKIIVSGNGIIAKNVDELESQHNYPLNCKDIWVYTLKGAGSLNVKFDSKTNVEDKFDYIYIYDVNGKEVGKYTGTALAGKTIKVSGDTVKIQLVSDEAGTEWGFKVTSVTNASGHTHSYSSKVTKAATCTVEGSKTFTCSCGDTYTEAIAKLSHNLTKKTVASTCTTNGYEYNYCSLCKGEFDKVSLPLAAHTWSAWKVTIAPTTTTEGEEVRTCSVCEETETRSIPKLTNSSITSKTPELLTLVNTINGPRLTWNEVDDVSGYWVYRKTSGGKFAKIATTYSTTYTDATAKSGTNYVYTVKAYKGSTYSKHQSGLELKCLTSPTVSSASNTTAGANIKWDKIAGATRYYIYRKTLNSTYKNIGNTTGLSFVDKTGTSGTKYYYIVRAGYGKTLSSYRAGTGLVYLTAPTVSSVSNTTAGVKVAWGKVTGASGYYVYRKTAKGSYSRIGTTTAASFTDKTAKSGTTYYYTVRAYKGTTLSSYNAGKGIKFLTSPTISSVVNTTAGAKAVWGKVTGASGYYVYRKTANGSYSRVGTTTATSFTDKTAKKGTTYYYTVRAYSGKTLSSYKAGTRLTRR